MVENPRWPTRPGTTARSGVSPSRREWPSSCWSLRPLPPGNPSPLVFDAPAAPGVPRGHAGWLRPFFAWDAGWYEDIATHGYAWSGKSAAYQNPAFWPLWPLVLAALHAIAPWPGVYRVLVVCVTVSLTLASAVTFHLLACASVSRAVARRATILYLVFPGMHYLLRSYPAGLLNIGVCLVLLTLMRKRVWLSSVLAGVLMAAGPLALSASITLAFAALARQWRMLFGPGIRAGTRMAALAKLMMMTALSLAGLFAFMAYLRLRFGDALLFLGAERAWGHAQTLL